MRFIVAHINDVYVVNSRERNREHAKRSRSKKKDLTKSLEETVAMLREETKKMKDFVSQKLLTSQEDTDKMIKERIVTPSDRFIAALKSPSNSVLSKSAISYLQSLGKDCKR
jgi:DNA relaxase NicK